MAAALEPNQKIVYAVGAVVLTCHEIERHFKFLVPFLVPGNTSATLVVARHAKIARMSLGELAGHFMGAASGEIDQLSNFVKKIVEERNEVVHHFHDCFGDLLNQTRFEDVLDILRDRHGRAIVLLHFLRELAVALAETMRDQAFAGAPEQAEIAGLCEQARSALAG